MIKVGITGGIGSGKSMVCKLFGALGVPIYNSDLAARIITDTNNEVKKEIEAVFGEEIYENEILNRDKFASIIFKHKEQLELANAIIHPRVSAHFQEWQKKHAHCKYIIQESAIIFESKLDAYLDKVIVIYAPEDIRIKRIIKRNTFSHEKIIGIMKNQLSDTEKKEMADDIIINDNNHFIIKQVFDIHQKLMAN